MFIKSLYRTDRGLAEEGPFWIIDDFDAAFVDPDAGRVLAFVSYDPNAAQKFCAMVVVPLWRALWLLRRREAVVASLLSFPRLTLEMLRVPNVTIEVARARAEFGLGSQ